MKLYFKAIIATTLAASTAVVWAGFDDSCKVKSCKPGDIVKVFSPKDDQAPICATKALHAYVAAVIGVRQVQARLGVKPAPEEEYKDEMKVLIDGLRAQAGVSDFKQAAQACSVGKNKQRVTVIETDATTGQMRVAPTDGSAQFWIWDVSLER